MNSAYPSVALLQWSLIWVMKLSLLWRTDWWDGRNGHVCF